MTTPDRPDRGHETVEAAPWCRDALFLVTTFGDGECAILVRGWDALCAKVVAVHYHDPDRDQRDEVLARLTDWDEWDLDPEYPYHLYLSYEDGSVSVTRVTKDETAPAHDDLVAALRLALDKAESYIASEYEGTASFAPMMAELEPCRAALSKSSSGSGSGGQ